jgi:ribosome-associated protein
MTPPSSPDPTEPTARAERPSKTRRKQQSHDLQSLGEALAAMGDDRLTRLVADGAMSESLLDALREYKRTRSFEGQRRQMQYVGKLMRQLDAEPLREAVAEQRLPGARATLRLHQAERWRDELIADDAALTRWIAEFPDSDAQVLRSLVRAARKDGVRPLGERQGRHHRDVFRFVQQALDGADTATASDHDPDDDRDD